MVRQEGRDGKSLPPDDSVWLEEIRRAALEAAQGSDSAARAFVVEGFGARGEALRVPIEEDGGRVLCARAGGRVSLEAARTLVRGLEPAGTRLRAVEPAARLVRRALAALERMEAPVVLVLEEAERADESTVRWWWSLAHRMRSADALLPAILVAMVGGAPSPVESTWTTFDRRLAGTLGVRKFRPPRSAPDDLSAVTGAGVRGIPRTGSHECLLRSALACVRGNAESARVSSRRAALRAEEDDDLTSDGAAALAAACASLAAGDPDAGERLEFARAAATIAGDAMLHAATSALRAFRASLDGDVEVSLEGFTDALPVLDHLPARARALVLLLGVQAAARARDLPRAARLQRTLSDFGGDSDPRVRALQQWAVGLLAAYGPERAGRTDLASAATTLEARGWPLLSGRAWLDAAAAIEEEEDDPMAASAAIERARAAFGKIGNHSLLARLEQTQVEGLSAAGRAPSGGGAPEILDSARALAGASGHGELVTVALDAALGMIASRGGSASVSPDGESRVVALRGRANLIDGPHRLGPSRISVEIRGARTGRGHGTLQLERLDRDPPFSRNERRLLQSIAGLAGAAFDRPEPASKNEDVSADGALPALDDRISAVERITLVDALARNEGNLSRTARAMGLSRNGLKMKLVRHGLR